MLPKTRRIRATSFGALLKNSRSIHSRLISLSYTQTDTATVGSIFAIVVPKSVSKRAVDRNTLRRQAYALIRAHSETILPGYACIFFLKKGAKGIARTDLQEAMTELLKKAGVLI